MENAIALSIMAAFGLVVAGIFVAFRRIARRLQNRLQRRWQTHYPEALRVYVVYTANMLGIALLAGGVGLAVLGGFVTFLFQAAVSLQVAGIMLGAIFICSCVVWAACRGMRGHVALFTDRFCYGSTPPVRECPYRESIKSGLPP